MSDFFWKNVSPSLVEEISYIILVLLSVSAAFWVLIGRFKLHNLLINIYISFAILQVVLKETASFGEFIPIVVFSLLIIFFTAIDNTVFEIHLSGSGLRLWQVVVLSFLEAGLFVSIVASLVPSKYILGYISKNSLGYFISPWASIVWMAAPLLFLIIIGRRGK